MVDPGIGASEVSLDLATYERLARLFAALGDATRTRIVHLLLQGEACTSSLAEATGVTEACVSQHLRLLRSLRLIRSRRAGKFVYHTLDDAHIALLIQIGLTHLTHGDVE